VLSASGALEPLIWARAIHYAATLSVTGAIFFLAFIAEPSFREAKGDGLRRTRAQLAVISWVGLGVAVISGGAWVLFLAAQIADLPLAEAWSEGTPWALLTDTDFGRTWTIRLVLAALLAASLPWLAFANPVLARQRLSVAIALAAALTGTLAFAGHAAAGTGLAGDAHLVADVAHLIAGAAWLGALIPLALILRAALVDADHTSLAVTRAAVRRFSTLGIISVATLIVSGAINTLALVGSIEALLATDYGRFLLIKIALFLIMLLFAAINRMLLTPRLSGAASDEARGAARQIWRNTLAEAVLGAIVIAAVSLIGTLPPDGGS
jgi:copper resistance protein D